MDCGPGTLRHRYDLFEKLGQGTMGRVHRARRRADGVEFVVKQIRLAGFSETSREDILNEVCVMRQLEHPNVVAYEESFVLDDELSIVMEHLIGGDMGRAIKTRGGEPLPEEEIWEMLIQLTEGLHHLHDRRVLHRDIKLENIFVDGRGAVKIGDLGLGRLLSTESSHARTGVGTPLYFSPEMCEERPYNEKSDVWALGCLVYELCCFTPPFAASNQLALAQKILHSRTGQSTLEYTIGVHWLAAVAATHLSRGPSVCAGQPSVPERRAPSPSGCRSAVKCGQVRWCSDACPSSPIPTALNLDPWTI